MKDNNNTDWVSVLKDRLESYTPDVPEMDFGQIKKKMLAAGAAGKMAARRSRLNILKYAAAVAVVAAAGLLLFPRQGGKPEVKDSVAETNELRIVQQPADIISPAEGAALQPEVQTLPPAAAQPQKLIALAKAPKTPENTDNTFIPTQPTPSAGASAENSVPAGIQDGPADTSSKEQTPAAENTSAAGQSSVTVVRDLNSPDFNGYSFAEPARKRSPLSGKLALGASGILATDLPVNSRRNAVPNGMMMYTDRNGNIYYSMGAPTAEYHYSAPVSGGISIRYNIAGPFYAESGVRFTYLHTWVSPSGARQDLLFAGIPIGLGVNMLQASGFNLYALFYGMPSKCIMGRESTFFPSNFTKLAEIPIMWSAGASLGASYNFTPVFGLFAEPTLSYYFSDAKAPQTMFKDSPYYFTINLGVRFSFE